MAAAGLAVAAVGCADAGTDAATLVERDSAGIQIVEAPRELIEGLPAWSLDVDLDLGGVDARPEHQFYQVRGVRRLPSGEIVVVNSGSQEIRLFDADGAMIASIGGEGDGPGEFRVPTTPLPYPPDSLLVFDGRTGRMTMLGPGLELARVFSLPPNLRSVNPLGVTSDGRLVVTNVATGFPVQPGIADSFADVLLLDAAGAEVGVVGRYWQGTLMRTRTFMGGVVFGAVASFGLYGDALWTGTAKAHELTRVDLSGSPRQIVRWWGPDLTVTEEDRQEWRESMRARARTPEERASLEAMLEEVVFADEKPAYQQALVSDEGDVWVEDAQPVQPRERRWLVFDPAGRPRALVHTPPTLTVTQVGQDLMIGTVRDDLDVTHVVVSRIVR